MLGKIVFSIPLVSLTLPIQIWTEFVWSKPLVGAILWVMILSLKKKNHTLIQEINQAIPSYQRIN